MGFEFTTRCCMGLVCLSSMAEGNELVVKRDFPSWHVSLSQNSTKKILVILNHWKTIPFRVKSTKPILNLTFLESGWAAWSGPFSRTENWLFMFVQKKEPPKSQVQFLSSLNWSQIHPLCFGKPTNDFDCGWFYHVLPQYCWWISTCFMFKILISIFYWLSF